MVGHAGRLRVAPGRSHSTTCAVQENCPATSVLTDGRLRDFTVRWRPAPARPTSTSLHLRAKPPLRHHQIRYRRAERGPSMRSVLKPPRPPAGTSRRSTTARRSTTSCTTRRTWGRWYASRHVELHQVMVINIGAFNKGLGRMAPRGRPSLPAVPAEIHRRGFSPREPVDACKPVVIIPRRAPERR